MKTYFSVRRNTKKTIWGLVFMMLIGPIGWAQEKTLAGSVIDANGKQPLPGASVAVKGTSKGAVTDFGGNFEIKASKGNVLVVSYVGYKTKEIIITDETHLTITLSTENNLNEVVVVGYGTQKKLNLSGSVATVDMKKLESRPTANISQSLQGTVANLNITFPSGAPGGSARINIRGFTSINGGSPLILIDGVPSSEGDLTRMNPEDVKSISVLKDASSAAIYGARAAFGVLLITTKTGGKNKITYSNSFIWGKPTITPDPITDPYIFTRLLDISTNNTPWDYVNPSDETYAWARDRSNDPTVPSVRLDPQNPDRWQYMGNTNWNDYFFNKTAFSENHNLSISGQKDSFTYYVSGNHTLENGLNRLAEDSWTRNALRSKMQIKPYEWMKFENNTFLAFADRKRPTYNITNVYNIKPTDVVKNPDGTWANTDAGYAAARMLDGGKTNENTTNLQTTNKLDLTFFDKALTLTGEHTYQKNYVRSHWDGTKFKIGLGPNLIKEETNEDYAYESLGENKYSVLNLYGTYTKTIDKHNFTAVAGYNKEVNKYEWFSANREELISSSLPNMALATGKETVGWAYSDWAINGIFGRLNYIFNEKYIIEFNGRYDGSSRFPSDSRYGFFPSVSGAWIASKEEFLKPYIDFMSFLKFRVSRGSLGNQSVGDYGYINAMSTGQSGYLINGEYPKTVYAPGLNVDPNNYTWEKVETTNFGMDLGFFKGALNASFDYYIRNTIGMLTPSQELPGVLGTNPPLSNAADLRNKGWELTLGYNNSLDLDGSPFNYGASIVLSDSETKITKFKNDGQLFSQWREGQKVGEIWGLENDGFFKDQAEIDKLDETAIIPWGALDIVPGWPKYVDQDGDGKILKSLSANDPKDLKLIGNTQPRYQIGFNMNVSWKGFDLSGFLQGVGKRDYYPNNYLFWGPYQQPYANTYPHLLDFYRGAADSPELRAQHSQSYINAGLADANTNANYPVLQSWLADQSTGLGLATPQTKYLLNAAYLRVKNITLGYTIPNKLLDKIKVSQLRFYVTGENIYEWSAIKKYIDPEATGENGYAYPFNRKLSVGMNVTF
ncbi:SusC/RagA family TonB-linked outer membrane protein [Flavobacterium sp. ZB4P13]|uniref:SusC/RagA family TonB-linked outer membrane protein n=1 Tax=Flavobacterium sp. ZB4P13 TaxID=3401728 RepID=UPI003AB0EC50